MNVCVCRIATHADDTRRWSRYDFSFTVDVRHRRLFSSCMTRIIHTSYGTFATVNGHTCEAECAAQCVFFFNSMHVVVRHQFVWPLFIFFILRYRWFGVDSKQQSDALNSDSMSFIWLFLNDVDNNMRNVIRLQNESHK